MLGGLQVVSDHYDVMRQQQFKIIRPGLFKLFLFRAQYFLNYSIVRMDDEHVQIQNCNYFLKVIRGLSQAAACDGTLYQMMPEGNETLPAPGVVPI